MGAALPIISAIAPIISSVAGSLFAPSAPSAPAAQAPPVPAPIPAPPPLPVAEPTVDPNAAINAQSSQLQADKRRAASQQQGVTLLNQSTNSSTAGKTLLGG